MTETSRVIALTMGDPSGIGPELCIKALRQAPVGSTKTKLKLFGDLSHLQEVNALLGMPVTHAHLAEITEDTGPLGPYPAGTVAPNSGESAYRAITGAARACLSGRAHAMVTAPIHKEALNLAGYKWPGHTELLAHLACPGSPPPVRMLLINHELRVLLHTIHIPLKDVPSRITPHELLKTIEIAHHCGHQYGQPSPKIAVAGLNPHASEGGNIGDEDIRVVAPAIKAAQDRGIHVTGPWPGDTIFMRARMSPDDIHLVIALYHDQGLIPIKYLGIDHGVNITLGLPFVRTSVDHGTAFDIAHQWQASPASLLEAIDQARAMAQALP
ncbi:MAG: 4-hydroxythreonine-4-phosphate dehydrogenase PdxA, partial [Burkholderiaceae bacterium]